MYLNLNLSNLHQDIQFGFKSPLDNRRILTMILQVCALLAGGGYAEKVNVPEGQVLPIPKGVSMRDAASFPEVACSVWSSIFKEMRLSKGEDFLVCTYTYMH